MMHVTLSRDKDFLQKMNATEEVIRLPFLYVVKTFLAIESLQTMKHLYPRCSQDIII